MQITFSAAALPKSGAVIVPLFEDGKKPKAYADLNDATDGALERAVKAAAFKAGKGKALEIVAPQGLDNSRVILIGAGASKDFTALDAEALGGGAVARVLAARDKNAAFARLGRGSGAIVSTNTAPRKKRTRNPRSPKSAFTARRPRRRQLMRRIKKSATASF